MRIICLPWNDFESDRILFQMRGAKVNSLLQLREVRFLPLSWRRVKWSTWNHTWLHHHSHRSTHPRKRHSWKSHSRWRNTHMPHRHGTHRHGHSWHLRWNCSHRHWIARHHDGRLEWKGCHGRGKLWLRRLLLLKRSSIKHVIGLILLTEENLYIFFLELALASGLENIYGVNLDLRSMRYSMTASGTPYIP